MALFTLTKDNFEKEIKQETLPVLVDFWAEWCGPCRMVGPIVDELAEAYDGKVKVGKLNVDEEPEIAQQFGVMSIPTLILFKNGEVVDQMVGAQPKEALEEFLTK